MARFDWKKAQAALFKRTEGYAANVAAIYRVAFAQIIEIVKKTELEEGEPFSFSAYGYTDEITPILRGMYSQVYQTIRGGVEKEWLNSNEHNDELVRAVFGDSAIDEPMFAKYFMRNQEAMNAFFARKTAGLSLSQKVWRYVGQYKDELENALDLAIGEGVPANRLAKDVQKYLNEPDRFYRRFRVRIGENEDGTPKYGRIWKRRIFDNASQSYKWIDADPKDYHPGRGVYRSSYRNAQRLTRTETNIAYRTADYDRWQRLDFVIGIEIKLSNNHPDCDICDDLKGVYPKDFKWTGWHPNCRCYQVPVLAKEDEVDAMVGNILDGEPPSDVACGGEVREMPRQFNEWVSENGERIATAKERGTLPYFLRDNMDATERALSEVSDDAMDAKPIKKPLPQSVRERRKEIERIAASTLIGQTFSHAAFAERPIAITKRGIKEWLNQPFEDASAKNEALLDLQTLLDGSIYRGCGPDNKGRGDMAHLCEVVIGLFKGWVIIRDIKGVGLRLHSISDNPSILGMLDKK